MVHAITTMALLEAALYDDAEQQAGLLFTVTNARQK